MDRTVWISAVIFVALAVVGLWMAVAPMAIASAPGDIDAVRAVGAAMFSSGLTAFLVVTLHADYHARRG